MVRRTIRPYLPTITALQKQARTGRTRAAFGAVPCFRATGRPLLSVPGLSQRVGRRVEARQSRRGWLLRSAAAGGNRRAGRVSALPPVLGTSSPPELRPAVGGGRQECPGSGAGAAGVVGRRRGVGGAGRQDDRPRPGARPPGRAQLAGRVPGPLRAGVGDPDAPGAGRRGRDRRGRRRGGVRRQDTAAGLLDPPSVYVSALLVRRPAASGAPGGRWWPPRPATPRSSASTRSWWRSRRPGGTPTGSSPGSASRRW